jgi:serine/threonine protein kinase
MSSNTNLHIYILSEFDEFEKIHTKENFSKIYIAIHRKTKEKVILKLYLQSIKNNIHDYISKEILINKYLTENTNITMKLKGLCLDDTKDLIFLVIEYGDYSLYDYMRHTNYTNIDVKKLFFEGAKLLFIMHSYGIIHNDIKLENLILHNQQLKIIDFGLSDFLYYSPSKNVINYYVCTEYTKAPDTRKSFETDIYSFALTIIHLLTKNYFKPHVNYLRNDFTITKIDKNNNNTIYESEYFIDKLGGCGYDLLCMMLNPNNLERINSIDILSHPYFENFQKIDNNKFKVNEFIKDIKINPVKSINNIRINKKINDIIFSQNTNYCEKEYIQNNYELKYKLIHIYHLNKIKINFKFNKVDSDYFKILFENNYYSYDSIINTIIIIRQYKMFESIQYNDIVDYMNIFCIIYNSINSYGNSNVSYENYNNNINKIDNDKFYLIYINCLELILVNKYIYFAYTNISYYVDKIIYETNIIKEKYHTEFKSLCLNSFLNLILLMNINDTNIQFNKIIIFSINKIVAEILNKTIQEYNNNPCLSEMKIDDIF